MKRLAFLSLFAAFAGSFAQNASACAATEAVRNRNQASTPQAQQAAVSEAAALAAGRPAAAPRTYVNRANNGSV